MSEYKKGYAKTNTYVIDPLEEMEKARRAICQRWLGWSIRLLSVSFEEFEDGLMATDGHTVFYSKEKVIDVFDKFGLGKGRFFIMGVLIHELQHIINLHHVRRNARDPKGWNIATDLHINAKVHQVLSLHPHFAKFSFKDLTIEYGGLFDLNETFLHDNAEKIYQMLDKKKDEDGNVQFHMPSSSNPDGEDQQDGGNVSDEPLDDGGLGGVMDLPEIESRDKKSSNHGKYSEQEIQDAIDEEISSLNNSQNTAELSETLIRNTSGDGVGSSGEFSSMSAFGETVSLKKPQTYNELLELVKTTTKKGANSFANPSKRSIMRITNGDLARPSPQKVKSGECVFIHDISSSMDYETRQVCNAKSMEVLNQLKHIDKVHVMYANSRVINLKKYNGIYNDEDGMINPYDYYDTFHVSVGEEIEVRDFCGGGTRIDPCLNMIERTPFSQLPEFVIYFTDGYCSSGKRFMPHNIPFIWAYTDTDEYCPSYATPIYLDHFE